MIRSNRSIGSSACDETWVDRKKSVLDAVREDLSDSNRRSARPIACASTSISRRCAISSAHREPAVQTTVRNIREPEDVADLTDYPRIAKIQSDLVVHALASGQTKWRPTCFRRDKASHGSTWSADAAASSRLHDQQCGVARVAAYPARNLPLARRGVRLLPEQAEVVRRATATCSTTRA